MSKQDFTLTFDTETDPVFQSMPDAGEDLDGFSVGIDGGMPSCL